MTQVRMSPPAEPTWRAMSADTMKMPEPIIDPATIIVESSSPSPRMNPVDLSSTPTAGWAIDLASRVVVARPEAGQSVTQTPGGAQPGGAGAGREEGRRRLLDRKGSAVQGSGAPAWASGG